LREAGLVNLREEGKQTFYTLNQERICFCCGQLMIKFAPDEEATEAVGQVLSWPPLFLPNYIDKRLFEKGGDDNDGSTCSLRLRLWLLRRWMLWWRLLLANGLPRCPVWINAGDFSMKHVLDNLGHSFHQFETAES
jgi:hypothetical protein